MWQRKAFELVQFKICLNTFLKIFFIFHLMASQEMEHCIVIRIQHTSCSMVIILCRGGDRL